MPVPTHVRDLARSCPAFVADAHLLPARRLFDILCRFAELHSFGETSHVTLLTERVSAAIMLEEELCSWETQLPTMWNYNLVRDNSDQGESDQYMRHKYTCPWQAYVWTQHRTCRVLVHTALLGYLDALALRMTNAHPALIKAYILQQEASREVLCTTMRDLRAGMAYILGLYDEGKGNACLSPEQSGVFGLLGAVQALMGVGGVVRGEEKEKEEEEWLCGMLGDMGRRWGIGLATVLGRK